MQEKFDTKYSFVENEKEILGFWKENDCFKKLKAKNVNGPKYRFIDGPITANNPMGIHHVWGRTLKDTFIKYKAMKGYDTHYRNGFDSQGLWVEVEVEKELGFKSKHDIEAYGLDKFTEKCIERVKKYSGVITEQSQRLGQWMDWDNSYYTYTDENITGIWAFLKKCHESGWIREVYKPMPWCSRCGTSLSEHEMTGSYKEIEHEAVFFKLPILGTNDYILVWTTTPWTLSANVALAVNAEMNYVRIHVAGEEHNYVTSENYYKQKFEGKDGVELLDRMKGSDLAGLEYETCFPEMEQQKFAHKIVLWDEVDETEGCGVVHIAPGCGAEDFALGESLGLPKIIPVDEYGIFYDGFSFLTGVDAQESRQMVFDELKNRGKLFYTHKYKHSYPVCWRCKKEILFRLVKEWAISVDELRPRLIKNANKVQWNPPYQGKRMLDWLENMSDWNISRKRFYGLPLPFYVCPDCGKLTVIGSKEELYEMAVDKSKVDAIPHLHRPWIDDVKIACPDCGAEVERIPQVGDVWLDAGIVPFSTLKYFSDRDYWKEFFPAEYVLEMKEQIRLWFYSLLFMSTVLIDEPPYEKVGTHGMVVSEDGSRFSKTGFMIRFDEAANIIGADASRYIYASTAPANDVRFGFTLGDEAKRKLLAFWNLETFFATYADIDNTKVDLSKLDPAKLSPIDRWLLIRTNKFIKEATYYMDDNSTREVIIAFEAFVNDISNFYIRVNRSRFWSTEVTEDKQNAYTVLFYAIKTITGVIAPITPFIAETTWQRFVKRYSDEDSVSVFLSKYPEVTEALDISDDRILADVDTARDIISLGLKLRNEKQIKIRQPLSTIYVSTNEKNHNAIETFESVIKSELNVGEICELEDTSSLESNFLTVNFKVAGRVLKNRANEVKDYLAGLDAEAQQKLSDAVKNGETVKLEALELEVEGEVFTLNSKPADNVAIFKNNEEFVALNTEISEELQRAGILRDIIRQCQVFRKEAGFDVSDRIFVSFETESELIKDIILEKQDKLSADLLATLEMPANVEYTGEIDLDGIAITVKLQRKK
ncbi:MAG: isoleucine--tRNA ligase [Clostridia bacterium]|nr:isoleucine--tRNA ligase [Clostridia bacterium]